MMAAIANERNEPLRAVENYFNVSKQILNPWSTRSQSTMSTREMLDQTASQTLMASGTIIDLRDFMEKRERRREPHRFNKIVGDALALIFAGAIDKNIELNLTLGPALSPVLIGVNQTQRLFINLINNNAESMFAMERRERVVATCAGHAVIADVTVCGGGAGLRLEISSHFVGPFWTTKEEGLGIRLTICRSIAKAHGRRICLLSGRTTGTGYCFQLPIAGQKDLAA